MLFTTEELSKFFTNFKGPVSNEVKIEEVNTDSRIKVEESIFVPIVGENFDGHQFAEQAIRNGAVAVLWDKSRELPASVPEQTVFYFVDDTTEGLQQLASHFRDSINPIVIGITGSNGKTTTKDLVASMVKTKYVTHHTIGNFNNQIGLPLTILAMKRDTEVLVLEMGMSNFGEIELLSRIAKPDYAIITNIGESHIEFLGSREGIAKAKLEIRSGLKEGGLLIIDGDEELLRTHHNEANVVTCGFGTFNDVIIQDVSISSKGTAFRINDEEYTIPLLGKHHSKNAAYAIILGRKLNVDLENRKKALLNVELTSMRFELLKGKNQVSIINDAYNASPTSMKAAIEVVKQMDGFKDRVVILGDVLELGEHAERLHRSVADVITAPVSAVFTLGEYTHVISEIISKTNHSILAKHFHSREELVDALKPYLREDCLLLFKASRGLKFESIINKILQ
ncbi:UDP-N-acetylmuramoyl-tripeptide--D-alanyl-D-alanine ligase [Oceanobacillus piezotolerans]|uniref:UDP-N-acetylmuramoyl-tripeptide--D-alanyl-D-alanine ligase n=1 Tax=Oceanobacillus piezotolerans TaxID=2448030 RepID=A0A498DIB0_9BACI|nr:UDP-N-acetylmuramoyl-tripeptide--D-alanyl-D-alanine ligase [Oceanobacillus piezotolerans]RLL45235.1 UDP-N-acetylmuramoyl-tripeptide--D-alanyl-D-alanine ligase [Oceanobacillus piezotolerans]